MCSAVVLEGYLQDIQEDTMLRARCVNCFN